MHPSTLARLAVGEQVRLQTSLVVREDALTLYGFLDADERATFELLQSATGVGPRLAQAVLAVHPPAVIRRAVATEDLAALTLVPGIGRKGAQRLVLELRDRIGDDAGMTAEPAGPAGLVPGAAASAGMQVRAALMGLGYGLREAEEALAQVAGASLSAPGSADPGDVAALLRAALAVLRPR